MSHFRRVLNGKVIFNQSPDEDCPCGSGKEARNCCLTKAGFRKMPVNASPPGPRTGFAHPRCYAKGLADCSREISREHYLSQSVLRHLNQDGALRVEGLTWGGRYPLRLPTGAYASKVLCKRHNTALSPLDALAVPLFEAIRTPQAENTGEQSLRLFCGHDVERWLLKTMCGLLASNAIAIDEDASHDIPHSWVQALFAEADWQSGQGLYANRTLGAWFSGEHGVRLQFIGHREHDTSGIGGMCMWVCGLELFISMTGFRARQFDRRVLVYRPMELHYVGANFERSIAFTWAGPADNGTIQMTLNGSKEQDATSLLEGP
jgi:hypothetical protein